MDTANDTLNALKSTETDSREKRKKERKESLTRNTKARR